MKKAILPAILISAVTSIASVWGIDQIKEKANSAPEAKSDGNVHYANYANSGQLGQPIDFSKAAEESVKSVVHIKTMTAGKTMQYQDPFAQLFGQGPQQYRQPDQVGSGSGVIVSSNGYIVTNNHVVMDADEVSVTFDNKLTKKAKVVGTDPSTDLAVIKVDGEDYPFLVFGNSDDVKLGQWVLAVGYPLNLDATVTAGIVSAKSRNIGINRRNATNAIESFIQTDAAVNPGNSGGALVNTDGLLIGINSAIASPTGSYAGYSYAIPANLVRKVTNDIIKHGSVLRGYLGTSLVDAREIPDEYLSELNLSKDDVLNSKGVLVAEVIDNSGAAKAGLRKGDFITSINGVETNTSSRLMELIAQNSPGDNVNIEYQRGNSLQKTTVKLGSKDDLEALIAKGKPSEKNSASPNKQLGIELKSLSPDFKEKYGIENGVQVTKIDNNGIIAQNTGIKEGFVITSINDQPVNSPQEVIKALNSGRRLNIGGTYPGRGGQYFYGFDI